MEKLAYYVPVFIKKRMFGHTFSVYVPPSSVSGTFYFPFSTYVPRLSFPGTFYFSFSTYVQASRRLPATELQVCLLRANISLFSLIHRVCTSRKPLSASIWCVPSMNPWAVLTAVCSLLRQEKNRVTQNLTLLKSSSQWKCRQSLQSTRLTLSKKKKNL